MSKSFQEKLNKILANEGLASGKVLQEDQTDSPTRVHPEHGQEVTHGAIDGNTVKVDATGPIPTGLDKTLKTNPGPSGPALPTNSDLPNGGKPGYGLGEETDDVDEEKTVEEDKKPPFLKKKDKESDGDKDDKKLDEEGQSLPAAKSDDDGNGGNARLKAGSKEGEKFNEEADNEEGEKSSTSVANEETEDDADDKKAVEEATKALFAGETISEALKVKTSQIFEETLSNRIKEYRGKLRARMTKQLNERVEEIRGELSSKVDGHLDLVVENWVKTHEVALESAIRAQLVEEFIGGLKSLFEEHYIEVPEAKVDALAEVTARVSELEGKLNEQIEVNVQLKGQVRLAEKTEIFNDVSKGMISTQAEKLRELAEGVEFQTAEQYKKALTTLKETATAAPATQKNQKSGKTLAEQTLEQNPNAATASKEMGAVKDVLARMAKK